MTEIVHCRVDFRLIHGQVVTKWLKTKNADTILIIDDNLAKDEFLGIVYKMAAPKGYKILILTIEEAIDMLAETSSEKLFVLFKDINTANKAVNAGFKTKRIQIGGLEGKPNKTVVFNHFPVNENDIELLSEIEGLGIEVYFQTVPGEKKVDLTSVINKLKERKK